MRVNKWLVHAIAQCADCNFEVSDYQLAQTMGRSHHIKTGHTVTVETGYCQKYESIDRKKGGASDE